MHQKTKLNFSYSRTKFWKIWFMNTEWKDTSCFTEGTSRSINGAATEPWTKSRLDTARHCKCILERIDALPLSQNILENFRKLSLPYLRRVNNSPKQAGNPDIPHDWKNTRTKLKVREWFSILKLHTFQKLSSMKPQKEINQAEKWD